MNSLSIWLANHDYELLKDSIYDSKLPRIRNKNGSEELIKVTDISEVNSRTANTTVNTMKIINNMDITGVMKYKTIDISDNVLYRTMKDYKTHLDILNPLKHFEDSGIFEILNEILDVLQCLRSHKTIHSDLKPSNIFLNDENKVILSDYCNNLLYKGGERQSCKNEDICFVCIDELLGKELDISSDIWNFGLIFYYIKSGKYPFIGKNMLETMKNIEKVNYKSLEGEYSNELNKLLKKIICKEKKDRLKLNKLISELKKLNKPELPTLPFERDTELPIPLEKEEEEENKVDIPVEQTPLIPIEENQINLSGRWRNRIDFEIDRCIYENNTLYFQWWGMGDEGVKYLCYRLDRMNNELNNTITINMRNNNISLTGLNMFSQRLRFFPNLNGLGLIGNGFGSCGKSMISSFIGWFSGSEPITDQLKFFSENLHYVQKLKILYLEDCCLGDEDIKYLSSHFQDIPSLEDLDIANNKIGDEGVKYLCEKIQDLPKLITLGLMINSITDIGGDILINNLHKCEELIVLTIEKNKLLDYDNFCERMSQNHPNRHFSVVI